MKYTVFSLLMFASLVMVSCGDDDDETVDVTPPTITMEEPHYGESFSAGGELHFEALFEDDVALATYNVTVHDNFDGHSHGRLAVTAFDFDQSFPLSGRADDVHEDFPIPGDATAGPYHFIVEAIDAAGNSTTFADGSSVELEIWITNEEMAHIHFHDSTGAEIAEVEGTIGEALRFYGEIEDEVGGLDHVEIKVGHMEEGGDHDHDHDHGGRFLAEDYVFEAEFEVEGATSVMIQDLLADANIVVSQAEVDQLEEGEHLYLIVKVEDEAGNIARSAIEIHFD